MGRPLTVAAAILILLPLAVLLYAYLLYPAVIWIAARLRHHPLPESDPAEWPEITITLPAYNEERAIAATIESLLVLDYPTDRRHVVVVSDASTDGTDEVVGRYADRGVRLIRLARRSGKTAAENAAAEQVRGNIVVNTDASVRILPGSLKPLIRVFQDPRIGVASGRDVSVGAVDQEANRGESGYVGFEMWLRSLETRAGSIVGASGCFYANRRELYDVLFPAALSRDFAAALNAVEQGYRAVSVEEAVCLVPRALSLRAEFRRKVRTMTRGLETLWYKRRVFRLGGSLFAFQLLSHKLIRWLGFPLLPLLPLGLGLLAVDHAWARWALLGVLGGLLLGGAAYLWPGERRPPLLLALPGFVVGSTVAGVLAWARAVRGELDPIWEPTRRPPAA